MPRTNLIPLRLTIKNTRESKHIELLRSINMKELLEVGNSRIRNGGYIGLYFETNTLILKIP